MPAQTPELEMMDEDRLIEEVLDKFVNCHEQTYEEFLRMFTHLSQDNVTKREAFETNSSENNFTSVKFTQRNEPNDRRLSNKAIFLHTSSQCSEEEQITIDDGQKAGSSFQGDLNRAGEVKVRHDSILFHGQNPKKAQEPHRTHLLSSIQIWKIQQILSI